MKYYQNTMTGEVVSEDEYSYAASQPGNWVLYTKIPRYTIETPPYGKGKAEFDEDGPLCLWEDVKPIYEALQEIANIRVNSSDEGMETVRAIATDALS